MIRCSQLITARHQPPSRRGMLRNAQPICLLAASSHSQQPPSQGDAPRATAPHDSRTPTTAGKIAPPRASSPSIQCRRSRPSTALPWSSVAPASTRQPSPPEWAAAGRRHRAPPCRISAIERLPADRIDESGEERRKPYRHPVTTFGIGCSQSRHDVRPPTPRSALHPCSCDDGASA